MKIQCDVCEKAEARVFCAADEAALCVECDVRVHHANKLAGKHLRYALYSNSSTKGGKSDDPYAIAAPLCDICQDRRAFMFCREDRAILYRECDLPIHSATEHTQKHNRFLFTGVMLSDYNPTPTHFDTQPSSSTNNTTTTTAKRRSHLSTSGNDPAMTLTYHHHNNNSSFLSSSSSSSSPSDVTQTYIAQSTLTTSSSSPTLTPHPLPNDYYYTSDQLFGDGSNCYSNDNDSNTVTTADYYTTTTTSSCEVVPSSSEHSGAGAFTGTGGTTGGGWHLDHYSTFFDHQYYSYSYPNSHSHDPAATYSHQFFTTCLFGLLEDSSLTFFSILFSISLSLPFFFSFFLLFPFFFSLLKE